LSAVEVIHRLTATAIDKGAPGRDDEYGYGIVDPVAALTADVPPLPPSPSAIPSSSPAGPTTAVADPKAGHGSAATIVIAITAIALLLVAAAVTTVVVRGRNRAA
jgi:hypothetical protein